MIKELDIVVFTMDFSPEGLVAGDLGTVVMVYRAAANGAVTGYEVEVVSADGGTVALLTVKPENVRARRGKEILHVREVA